MKKIIIGTRGSVLALAQAEYIQKILQEKYNNYQFEIKKIVTSGDKDLKSNWENSNTSLKSFFTKEIEHELLNKTIDIAVHSMKDMPSENPQGLICGAIPTREDFRDVLVSKDNILLKDLPQGAVVGTSSLRRTMNIKSIRPDLKIEHLRGNIHTRLKKLDDGQYDAILLAAAGLKRVGLADRITEYMDENIFLPAAAQGALYIQCRQNDKFILDILSSINNSEVTELVNIEREFSKIFDGGCHTPMGCFAKKINIDNEEKIIFKAVLYQNDKRFFAEVISDIDNIENIAKKAAYIIKQQLENGDINE